MDHTERKHVSDYLDGCHKGHANIDFVDAVTNDDTKLFLDPVQIEMSHGTVPKEINAHVQSFMDCLYRAYRDNDEERKKTLLAHAGEENATRFGYGAGDNGKGNTANGLLQIFKPLDWLASAIPTIKKASDLKVLLPNFAEDGLSDMLTNIAHKTLAEYTMNQAEQAERLEGKGHIKKINKTFWTWNIEKKQWGTVTTDVFCIDGREMLLVPKDIVRKKYLFSTDQYFRRVILERMIEEGGFIDDKGKPIPKKDIIAAKRYSGDHWEYDETVKYTKDHAKALSDYHTRSLDFYKENGEHMSDESLDEYLY
jgi:hypothetical protein